MSLGQKDNFIQRTEQKDKINYVFLRAHKLAAALYVVTNFIDNQDPLKWHLRATALDLLSFIKQDDSTSSRRLIDQLLSLIGVGLLSGGVSEMNFSILKQEYELLQKALEDRRPVVEEITASFPAAITAAGPRPTPPRATLKKDDDLGPDLSVRRGKKIDPDRRTKILEFVRSRGQSSIKEIIVAVPNLSPKTIQRELAQLVRGGSLKKEGDKRWSRYSPV